MAKIKIGYINILENSTIIVTNEDSDFPKHRLCDRKIGRLFKGATSVDHTIHIDQGASDNLAIDCLIIPAGHNLNGAGMYWEWSENDSDWTESDSWTQSGSGLIFKTIDPALTKRYWQLRMTGLSAPPELGELYLTSMYEFAASPQYGLKRGKSKNVERSEAPSGVISFYEKGDPRKSRSYQLSKITSAEREEMESWDNQWSGIKPFFFIDHAEEKFFAELLNDLMFTEERVGRFSAGIEILEIL